MRAPRPRAVSSASSTSTPDPSPTTNPSRSLSKGRAASAHRARVPALDDPHRVPYGVSARRAGRGRRRVGALGPEANGHLSRGEVDDDRRNEEGRYAPGAALEEHFMLPLDGREPADAR